MLIKRNSIILLIGFFLRMKIQICIVTETTQIIYRYVHVRLSLNTYSNRCDRDGQFSAGRNPRRCTRYNDSSQEIISINTLTAAFHRVRWISVLEFGILMRQIRIKKSQLTRYVNAYETISHCYYLPIYKFSQYAHKREKEREREEGEAFDKELRADHARLEISERLPDCSLLVCFLPVLPRCIPDSNFLIGQIIRAQYGG